MKIHIVSNSRNIYVQNVMHELHSAGYKTSFCSDEQQSVSSISEFLAAYEMPQTRRLNVDLKNAIESAEACVLITPSDEGSFMQLGYAAALGKKTFILHMERLSKPEPFLGVVDGQCVSIQSLLESIAAASPKECRLCAS